MPPLVNPGPLRSTLTAVAAVPVLFLGACGSASPGHQAPTKDAGASISQGAKAAPGATLSVVGVGRGDQLNVRAHPSAGAPVVARLAPIHTGLVPTGRTRSGWAQVREGQVTGWVKAGYVGYLGKPTDHRAQVAGLDIAPTRRELAVKAARALGLGDKVTVVRIAPKVAVVDVTGAGDDSVAGTRLRIVITMGEAGFQVAEAVSRPICSRGVTRSGDCI